MVPQEGETPLQKAADPQAPPNCHLPFMANLDDAAALYQREKDPFYIVAFMLQYWLVTLVERAIAEYVEKKNPRERSLQRGEAWRTFLELFEFLELKSGKGFRYLLSVLLRFSGSDDAPGNSLRRARVLPWADELKPFGLKGRTKTSRLTYRRRDGRWSAKGVCEPAPKAERKARAAARCRRLVSFRLSKKGGNDEA